MTKESEGTMAERVFEMLFTQPGAGIKVGKDAMRSKTVRPRFVAKMTVQIVGVSSGSKSAEEPDEFRVAVLDRTKTTSTATRELQRPVRLASQIIAQRGRFCLVPKTKWSGGRSSRGQFSQEVGVDDDDSAKDVVKYAMGGHGSHEKVLVKRSVRPVKLMYSLLSHDYIQRSLEESSLILVSSARTGTTVDASGSTIPAYVINGFATVAVRGSILVLEALCARRGMRRASNAILPVLVQIAEAMGLSCVAMYSLREPQGLYLKHGYRLLRFPVTVTKNGTTKKYASEEKLKSDWDILDLFQELIRGSVIASDSLGMLSPVEWSVRTANTSLADADRCDIKDGCFMFKYIATKKNPPKTKKAGKKLPSKPAKGEMPSKPKKA